MKIDKARAGKSIGLGVLWTGVLFTCLLAGGFISVNHPRFPLAVASGTLGSSKFMYLALSGLN